MSYGKQLQESQLKRDVAQGQKLYSEGGYGLSWEDYIKNNPTIKVNNNIKRGYLMARASNEAEELRRKLFEAYNRGEAQIEINGQMIDVIQTDSTEAFGRWVNSFIQEYVNINMGHDVDPEIYSNIFLDQVSHAANELTRYHEDRRNQEYFFKNKIEHSNLLKNIFDQYLNENGDLNLLNEADMDRFKTQMSSVIKNMTAQGISTPEALKTLIESINNMAKDVSYDGMQDFMDAVGEIEIGNNVPIKSIGAAYSQIVNNAIEISHRKELEMERQRRREKEEKQERIRDAKMRLFLKYKDVTSMDINAMTAAIYEAGGDQNDVQALVSDIRFIQDNKNKKPDYGALYYQRALRQDMWDRNLVKFMNSQDFNNGLPDPKTVAAMVQSGNIDPTSGARLMERTYSAGSSLNRFMNSYGGTMQTYIRASVLNGEELSKENIDAVIMTQTIANKYIEDELVKNPSVLQNEGKAMILIADSVKRAVESLPTTRQGDIMFDSTSEARKRVGSYSDTKNMIQRTGLDQIREYFPSLTEDIRNKIKKTQDEGGDINKLTVIRELKANGYSDDDISEMLDVRIESTRVKDTESKKNSPNPRKKR